MAEQSQDREEIRLVLNWLVITLELLSTFGFESKILKDEIDEIREYVKPKLEWN